jgi:hypothetical protein
MCLIFDNPMRHCHCHSNLLMAPPRESETCHFQSPMTIFSTPSSLALTPSSSSPHLGSPYIISKLCSLSNSTSFRATDFARVSSFNFLAYYSLTDVPEQLISRYLSHALALRFHRTPTSDCGTRTLVSGAAYGCGVQPASCSIVVACRAKQQRSRPDARRRRPHPRRPTLFLFFTFVDMWRAECGVRVWVCLGYLESNTFSRLERDSSNANVRFATCCNPSLPLDMAGWLGYGKFCSVDMIVHLLCVWDWRAVLVFSML